MNILREFRRVKKRSIATRIKLLLVFSVILIVNTYAWFSADKDVDLKGLEGDVTSWDVAYYVNEDENEILDQTAVFTIDELYPGMPERQDVVHVYNLGTTSTTIKYELLSVKIFGQEVLDKIKADNGIVTEGNTTYIFSDNTQYPFNVSYTYDRDRLDGKYVSDSSTPNAVTTFKFNVDWPYEEGANEEEKLAKDILDTKFGKDAYNFYKEGTNNSQKAVEIYVKITSSILRQNQ